MKKALFVCGLLVLLFGIPFVASAVDPRAAGVDLRCGDHTRIVSKGAGAVEVLMKCGEPMRKEISDRRQIREQSTEHYDRQGQTSRSRTATEFVDTFEVWFYNGGQGSVVYAVEIFNNVVLGIYVTKMPGSGLPDWEQKK